MNRTRSNVVIKKAIFVMAISFMMNRLLTIVILFASSLFLKAGEEIKEGRVKNEAGKEERSSKKGAGAAQKSVTPPSRKIKTLSHIASITLPTILFLLYTYFFENMDERPKGFFKSKSLNTVIFSMLFSVSGFYFYLYLETFLAKQMPSAIGKFFSALIPLWLSVYMMVFLFCLYWKCIPSEDGNKFKNLFATGLVFSLNNSLLSWFTYKSINRFLL